MPWGGDHQPNIRPDGRHDTVVVVGGFSGLRSRCVYSIDSVGCYEPPCKGLELLGRHPCAVGSFFTLASLEGRVGAATISCAAVGTAVAHLAGLGVVLVECSSLHAALGRYFLGGQAIRAFVGIDLNGEGAPAATTLLKLSHLLEAKGLTQKVFEASNAHLAAKGLMMRCAMPIDRLEDHACEFVFLKQSTEFQERRRDLRRLAY